MSGDYGRRGRKGDSCQARPRACSACRGKLPNVRGVGKERVMQSAHSDILVGPGPVPRELAVKRSTNQRPDVATSVGQQIQCKNEVNVNVGRQST